MRRGRSSAGDFWDGRAAASVQATKVLGWLVHLPSPGPGFGLPFAALEAGLYPGDPRPRGRLLAADYGIIDDGRRLRGFGRARVLGQRLGGRRFGGQDSGGDPEGAGGDIGKAFAYHVQYSSWSDCADFPMHASAWQDARLQVLGENARNSSLSSGSSTRSAAAPGAIHCFSRCACSGQDARSSATFSAWTATRTCWMRPLFRRLP